MQRLPVKTRSVLRTLEQVKREAKRSVRIVMVGPKNAGKTRLGDILNSSSSEVPGIFYSLDWEADTRVLEEEMRSADAILIVLDATGNLKEQVRRAQDLLKMNQSFLIVVNKVDDVLDPQAQVRPVLSFLDQFTEKVCFISTSKGINIEDELAAKIFDLLDSKGKGIALASKAPIFRKLAVAKIIHHTSAQNGLIGVVTILPGSDMPLLTANQLRMVLKIAAVYDEELSLSRLKELITVIGAGFTFRALARQLLDFVPGVGWIIKGAVAFAGTEALGQAAQKYFEKGYSHLKKENIKEVLRGIQGGKAWRKSEKN